MQQEGRAVGEQSVALHLSEADATLDVPATHWLVGDLVTSARGPHLELVGDHVTQALIVHHAHEDVRFQLQAADATVQALGAVEVVASGTQGLAEVLECRVLLGEREGSGVVAQAVERRRLARHALNQHADGHAGWEAVRVEQDVGHHATLAEGHVLGRPQTTQDALLPVATGKLVADGGVTWHAQCDADAFETARPCVVATYFDVIHDAAFLTPGEQKGKKKCH